MHQTDGSRKQGLRHPVFIRLIHNHTQRIARHTFTIRKASSNLVVSQPSISRQTKETHANNATNPSAHPNIDSNANHLTNTQKTITNLETPGIPNRKKNPRHESSVEQT